MKIKIPKDFNAVFEPKWYIKTLIMTELLASIVWIYPVSMQLKIFLLLYGIAVLYVNFGTMAKRIGKIMALLLIGVFVSFFSAIIYWDSYGYRGMLFSIFDLIIFFLVFDYIRHEDAVQIRVLLDEIMAQFLPVTFLIAAVGIFYFIRGEFLIFHPEDFFFTRILRTLGVITLQDYTAEYYYGYEGGYLYGCIASPPASGRAAFFSMVLSFYRLSEGRKNTAVFDRINIILQILVIVLNGMRGIFLGCAFFLGICAIRKIKVRFANRSSKILLTGMIVLFAMAAVAGISFINKRVSSIADREARNFDTQISRIESRMNDTKNISVTPADLPAEKDSNQVALAAYDFVNGNAILKRIDSISTTRLRIWVTAVFDIVHRGVFLGRPSNTVKGVNSNSVVTDRDFHNAYIRTLSIYGLFGGMCILIVFVKVLLECINRIQKSSKKDSSFYLAAGIIAQFAMEATGGGLSGSLDLQVIVFWLFSALILNLNALKEQNVRLKMKADKTR